MIEVTREAMREAFNYAKAVPADKLEWKPLDKGRSVLDLARELAKCPDWAYDLVAKKDEAYEESTNDDMESWGTVEQCEAACQEKLGRFFGLLASMPDDRLNETTDLPFGPGGSMKSFTMPEMIDYPRWNATYHQGQIAYIQTLYGDKDLY